MARPTAWAAAFDELSACRYSMALAVIMGARR